MVVAGKIALGVALAAAFTCTLLGLPGTFIVLLVAVVFDACAGWHWIPLWQLAVLAVVAVAAEVSDNLLGAWGVKKFEGSSRGMWGSTLGGVLGGVAGGSVGSALGALGGPAGVAAGFVLGPLLGGMVGGFLGAMLLEKSHREPERTWREAAVAGWGAFVGRTLGVLVKVCACAGMIALIVHAVYFKAG